VDAPGIRHGLAPALAGRPILGNSSALLSDRISWPPASPALINLFSRMNRELLPSADAFLRLLSLGVVWLLALTSGTAGLAAPPVRVTVSPSKLRQEFQGMGAGAMFYEGHVTSLAARQQEDQQKALYDDMFSKAKNQFLHLMIRETHEPENDNDDPRVPAFAPESFKYCEHALAIAKAARDRSPDMELFATLLTPPPWMKTNDSASGGGKEKATLKPKLELEFAEHLWAFLAHMARGGAPVKYLAISNECDWDHDQPGCAFDPDAHAKLFGMVGDYLDDMAKSFPDVPRAQLVGPNTLSAPDAVKRYIPALQRKAGKHLAVLGAHDYDPRGDRWGDMQKLARGRPVWMTEWCSRGEDDSPGQLKAAIANAFALQDAFNGGANVWMAYAWAYPKSNAGESLIHIDWGNSYTLRKSYHVYRQWGIALAPGMHVIESTSSNDTVNACAFLADDRTVVVHIVHSGDQEIPLQLGLSGSQSPAGPATRLRTSETDDSAPLGPLPPDGSSFKDTLKGRSLTSYRFKLR